MRARIRERERERERLCGLSLSIFLFWRDFETSRVSVAVLVFSTKFRVLMFGALGKKKRKRDARRDTKKKSSHDTDKYIHFGEDTRSFLSSLNVVGVVVDRLRTTTEW